MSVRIAPVATRRDLRRFIYLPEQLHRDHALWMPPIYWDERQWFNPRKNLAFRYSDTTLALAWKGDEFGQVRSIAADRLFVVR